MSGATVKDCLTVPTCKQSLQVQSSVTFLLEAARYFEKRPTGGEDAAHWSNVANAENCRRAADQLRSCQELLDDCPLPRRLSAAASLLYVHGYITQSVRAKIANALHPALATAASGGDAKQAPGDSPAERPEGQRPNTVRQQREGKR